jgi:hypothetical protein
VAAVSASGVFISSYQENDQEDYYFPPFTNSDGYVYPGDSYSDINFTHWSDGKGGDGQWMFEDDTTVQWIYTWPTASFPQPLPNGTGVETYLDYPDIPPYTNVCNPPTLAQEHCNFSVGKSPFTPIHMQRTADTQMKLATGGAAGSTKMNLWIISATATAYALPWAISGAGGGWASALTGTNIAPQNISIFGKTLGSDGNLYVVLPDNATPDATPIVTGGGDFYSFNISAQKSKLHILANGYPLADDHIRPQAYYCVGQKLNFEAVFSPSPSGLNYTSPIWNYTADYINNHWTDANGCEEYNIAPIPVMSNPTTAWFYNKQTQDATANLGMYCKFNNGQSVYLTRKGKFNVFTPTVTMSDIRSRHFSLASEVGGLYKLGLGESDNTGAMVYEVNYNTKNPFSGTGRITQLCMLQYSGIHVPSCSFSDYRLDGVEAYEEDTITPGTGHVILTLQDGPFNIDTLPNTLRGSFQDYIRFCPDAGSASDNIFVTLGIVSWNMNATATNSTTISPSETPDPTGPDNSNGFPIWTNTH